MKKEKTQMSIKIGNGPEVPVDIDKFHRLAGRHGGIEEAAQAEAVNQFRDLIAANWPSIMEIRDETEDQTIVVTHSVTFIHNGKQPIVQTKLAWSRKFKDEAEGLVKDPKQQELEIP